MRASSDRILTTHAGSLPRSSALLDALVRIENGEDVDRDEFREFVARDADHVIERQIASGVDIGGDGELPRIGFSNYVKDRMTGFGGVADRGSARDFIEFPEYVKLRIGEQLAKTSTTYPVPEAQDRVAYDPDLLAVQEEMSLLEDALQRADSNGGGFAETFVTAASPGIVSTTMLRSPDNPAYASDRAYLKDLAVELRKEYEFIVSQGHVLQVDSPDLALERQLMFRDRPLDEFLERVELHIETLNEALSTIPPDRVRLHVCWGNYDGPHVADVEMEPLLPLLYEANVGALSIPIANPRHQHDYKLFERYPLPESLLLIPGVIDVTTNYVEHPEVVADRICQVAETIGDHTRVIAGTDCGFSTFAGRVMVAEDVVWKKLEALADGAKLASERLHG